MMRTRLFGKLPVFLWGGLLAIAISGCATSTRGQEAIDESAPVAELPEPESETSQSDYPPQGEASPLSEFLGAVEGTGFSPDAQALRLAEEFNHREELIAQCMNEAGFDYLPVPYLVQADFNTVVWQLNDPDWVASYGFGIFTAPDGNSSVGGIVSVPVDPNAEYMQGLSESERRAFFETLNGPIVDLAGDEFAGTGSGGCRGWAFRQLAAGSVGGLRQSDEFARLFEAVDHFRETLAESISDADAEWATCMAGLGHWGFERQAQAQQSIIALMGTIDLDGWDWLELGPPSTANNPAWADAANQEVELAVADLECRREVDFESRRQAFEFDAERQFISDHRQDLNALLAAVEQRS